MPVCQVKQCIQRSHVLSIDCTLCQSSQTMHTVTPGAVYHLDSLPVKLNNAYRDPKCCLLPQPADSLQRMQMSQAQSITLTHWQSNQTMPAEVPGTVYYLNCLSVGWDDAEGSRGRLGARGAAGADCCHGDSSWCGGGGGPINVCLLLSWALPIHLPGHTQIQ